MLSQSSRVRSILSGTSVVRIDNIVQVGKCCSRLMQTCSLLDTTPRRPNINSGAHTMPPGFSATTAQLKTFKLPDTVTGGSLNREMGKQMVDTWRTDGIFQVSITSDQSSILKKAYQDSKDFFRLPHHTKASRVDSQSFAGYIASGEELTAGKPDYSEIFTITKDLPASDIRVRSGWPCHGPCPWPSKQYESTMKALMSHLGASGEKILKLIALGLGLRHEDFFSGLTHDGWHHMRVLRFPHLNPAHPKGRGGRGIGSHTDYGLLVLASQDDVGGLFIRPPIENEDIKNWEGSAAGFQENDDKWHYVPPVENVLTVFPGDMLQYLTNSFLQATPHKVGLNTQERFAFAYFHEPNFCSTIQPLQEFADTEKQDTPAISYGAHFTNMCLRNYPTRITAKRIMKEKRMELLK